MFDVPVTQAANSVDSWHLYARLDHRLHVSAFKQSEGILKSSGVQFQNLPPLPSPLPAATPNVVWSGPQGPPRKLRRWLFNVCISYHSSRMIVSPF